MFEHDNHKALTEESLKRQIRVVKLNLLAVLEKLYYYQTVVQAQIFFDYERHFGEVETELKTKRKKIEELERRAELIRQRQQKGEQITDFTLRIIDSIVKKESQRKQRLANYRNLQFNQNKIKSYFTEESKTKTYKQLFNNQGYTKKSSYKNANHQDIRDYIKNKMEVNSYRNDWQDYIDSLQVSQLYRSIVKKIHPDLHGETEEFKKYWYNVQDAYQTRNHHRLKLFYFALCIEDNLELASRLGTKEQLVKILEEFNVRFKEEKEKLGSLKTQEPFNLVDKLKNRLWVAKRKKFLREKLNTINRQIQIKENRINILTSPTYNDLKTKFRFQNKLSNPYSRIS